MLLLKKIHCIYKLNKFAYDIGAKPKYIHSYEIVICFHFLLFQMGSVWFVWFLQTWFIPFCRNRIEHWKYMMDWITAWFLFFISSVNTFQVSSSLLYSLFITSCKYSWLRISDSCTNVFNLFIHIFRCFLYEKQVIKIVSYWFIWCMDFKTSKVYHLNASF